MLGHEPMTAARMPARRSEKVAKPFSERLWGRTYDQFFDSRSPVTKVQFVGLLLLGGSLIVGGSVVLVMFLSELWPLSFAKLVDALLSLLVFGSIVCFGAAHVRWAFRK